MELLGKFQYQASYNEIGSENELCALLVGTNYSGVVKPNPEEVAACKWIELRELQKELDINSEDYAPWLRIALDYYRGCPTWSIPVKIRDMGNSIRAEAIQKAQSPAQVTSVHEC